MWVYSVLSALCSSTRLCQSLLALSHQWSQLTLRPRAGTQPIGIHGRISNPGRTARDKSQTTACWLEQMQKLKWKPTCVGTWPRVRVAEPRTIPRPCFSLCLLLLMVANGHFSPWRGCSSIQLVSCALTNNSKISSARTVVSECLTQTCKENGGKWPLNYLDVLCSSVLILSSK